MAWRLILIFLCVCQVVIAIKFSSVTNNVRLRDAGSRILGFVDINADKATDVLFGTGSNVSVYQWSRERERFYYHHLLALDELSHAVAVDLDGDGQVDILTFSRVEEEVVEDEEGREEGRRRKCYSMIVHWMKPGSGGPTVDSSEVIVQNVQSPPLILDINGDHIPDILTHNCANNTATIWISHSSTRGFETHSLTTPFTDYINSYYVDLTDDNLADVVIEGQGPSGRSLVFWQKNAACEKGFVSPSLAVPLPPPLSTAAIASSLAFNDLDGDGVTEAVGVSCSDAQCHSVNIHVLLRHQQSTTSDGCGASGTLPINFTHVYTVTVADVTVSPYVISSYIPVLGDINLDGFPDLILPISSSSGNLLIMIARDCPTNCNGSVITFDPHWFSISSGNLTSVFFFDLWEDGVLDLLVTERRDGDREYSVLALRQHLQDDHAFLKVLVLSGSCYHDCPSKQMPYGSVLPGVVVRFSTTDRMGRRKSGVQTLTSGHTHQLPFTIFGLGQTPSLVESLEVGMDVGGVAVSRQWTNLVPNSQIIIIPSPPSQPLLWRLELYLTPGILVYSTAAVLAALFLATAILVLLLQTREKIQDTREKRMAKHKFHFNAM